MPEKTTANPLSPEAVPLKRALPRQLVLASTSGYRRELLARLGLPFVAASPAVDEAPRPGEPPARTALRLAEEKARSVAGQYPDSLIIGSDQVADLDGEAIGKPGDHAGALQMLARLSGRTIVFHTGLALLDAASGECQTACVDVRSTLRVLSATDIEAYVTRDRPYDCAGAVKAETLGIALFHGIESHDPTALIGLPLIRLVDMLLAAGVRVLR